MRILTGVYDKQCCTMLCKLKHVSLFQLVLVGNHLAVSRHDETIRQSANATNERAPILVTEWNLDLEMHSHLKTIILCYWISGLTLFKHNNQSSTKINLQHWVYFRNPSLCYNEATTFFSAWSNTTLIKWPKLWSSNRTITNAITFCR